MKRIFVFIALAFLSVSAFSKNINLNPRILADGSIEIENVKGKVKDRLNVENGTGENLELLINGIGKDGKSTVICNAVVKANEKRYLPSSFEDNLAQFVKFIVVIKDVSVEFCTAQCEWSDLYLTITQVKSTVSGAEKPFSEADELLKWKNLLDSGVVTQEEYEAKKKQLLGL